MRHRCAGKKLGRNPAHRYAMERNFVCSVILHERVVTTIEKAKGMRRAVEKMITLGKRKKTLPRLRKAIAYLCDKTAARKLFDELGPRFASRPGGYTRILRLHGYRIGDGGSKAVLELVDNQVLARDLAKKAEALAEPAKS